MSMEKSNKQIQFEFLPLTLSIETLGGVSTPIVKRGTPLPTQRSQTFSTAADNQESVEIKVLLGERTLASKNLVLGSCLLKDIPPAPKGQPQVTVTFKVDIYCGITVEAIEKTSGSKIEATLKKKELILTNEIINRMVSEAIENQLEDKARSLIKSAELRIRKDQEENIVTDTTNKIEAMVSEIGLALTAGDKLSIALNTTNLEKLLTEPRNDYSIFDGFFTNIFKPKPDKKVVTTQQKSTASREATKPKTPSVEVSTSNAPLIQIFLESIDPELELKRQGAWEALNNSIPEGRVQAAHSMREVLRLLLDKLSPAAKVQTAPWYQKPDDGPAITRKMRIRYAIAGDSVDVSDSTLDIIEGFSAAAYSVYSKLSAQSHSDKKPTITATRMYLYCL